METLLPLTVTTPAFRGSCVLDARWVPIYDVFTDPEGSQLWMIGPAYAAKAFAGAKLYANGEQVEFELIPCRWHFTFQLLVHDLRWPTENVLLEMSLISGRCRYDLQFSQPSPRPRGYLAAQTLAKYDWPYLAEWIEHHHRLGIEHFFIYNNGERRLSEAIAECCRDPSRAGIVTEIPWVYPYVVYPVDEWSPWWPNDSHLYVQPPAVMHCLRKYGPNWEWMWCGDCDEFLNPRMPLPEILECAGSGWSLKGKWFGNAGLREVPASLRAGYTRAEPGLTSAAKLIVRPRDVLCYEVHQCQAVGHIIDMPTDCLYFHHYRAASDHYARRGPQFDDEHTNEAEDRSLCPLTPDS